MACDLTAAAADWYDSPGPLDPDALADTAACAPPLDAAGAGWLVDAGWRDRGRGTLRIVPAPDDAWLRVDGAIGWWSAADGATTWQLAAGMHLVQFGHAADARATGAFVATVADGQTAAYAVGLGADAGSAWWPCDGDPDAFVDDLSGARGADDRIVAAARMGDAAMACAGASPATRERFAAARGAAYVDNGLLARPVVQVVDERVRRRAITAARVWSIPSYALIASTGVVLVVEAEAFSDAFVFTSGLGLAAVLTTAAESAALRRAGVHVPMVGLGVAGLGLTVGRVFPAPLALVPLGTLAQALTAEAGFARERRARRLRQTGESRPHPEDTAPAPG